MEAHKPAGGRRIKIFTTSGAKFVRAVYVTGHFAVHETSVDDGQVPDNTMTITHIPTGRALTTYCTSEKQAREIAEWVKARFVEYGIDADVPDDGKLRTLMFESGLAGAVSLRLAPLQREYLRERAEKIEAES